MKLLEVEDAVYQKIARQSDSDGQSLSVTVHLLRTVALNPCFVHLSNLTLVLISCLFCTIFICVFLLFHKCVFLFLKTTAVTLINSIRHGQWRTDLENRSEATSVPQRIVLLGQGHQRHSKKSFNADMKSQKTSAPTNEPPSLIQSTLAPSIDSNSWLDNISTSQLHNTGTSDDSNSFIDGYTGTKLLIGEHG